MEPGISQRKVARTPYSIKGSVPPSLPPAKFLGPRYMIIHGIIRLPMEETSSIYKCMAAKYNIFLAAQHDADESIKTTHVHFLVDISGTQHMEAKAPLESFRKTLKLFDLKTQLNKKTYELLTLTQDIKEPYKEFETAVYILKGDRLARTIYTSWYDQVKLDLRYDAWIHHVGRTGLGFAEAQGAEGDPETVLASSRKITDWKLLQKMLWEIPHTTTDERTYAQLPTEERRAVDPRTLMKHVVRTLKNNDLKPTPKRVNEFVGSMLMYFEDTQDIYERTAIGQFTYAFDQRK